MYEASHEHNVDSIVDDVDLIDKIGSSCPHLKHHHPAHNSIELDRDAHE
jgi:hypothetical protein